MPKYRDWDLYEDDDQPRRHPRRPHPEDDYENEDVWRRNNTPYRRSKKRPERDQDYDG
jgi:hypothetical protein